jgi:hypothetical protein
LLGVCVQARVLCFPLRGVCVCWFHVFCCLFCLSCVSAYLFVGFVMRMIVCLLAQTLCWVFVCSLGCLPTLLHRVFAVPWLLQYGPVGNHERTCPRVLLLRFFLLVLCVDLLCPFVFERSLSGCVSVHSCVRVLPVACTVFAWPHHSGSCLSLCLPVVILVFALLAHDSARCFALHDMLSACVSAEQLHIENLLLCNEVVVACVCGVCAHGHLPDASCHMHACFPSSWGARPRLCSKLSDQPHRQNTASQARARPHPPTSGNGCEYFRRLEACADRHSDSPGLAPALVG